MSKKKITFQHPTLPFDDWEFTPNARRKSVYPLLQEEDDKAESKATAAGSDNRIFYISFGSGSSGNSCYVGTNRSGIIIDAGVKHDFIEATLKSNGLDIKNVVGLLLTHDHSDHVRYAYTLLRNNPHLRLFCTNRVLHGILRRHNISKRIKDYHQPIFKEIPFRLGKMEITAFEVPHDGTDNMGFSISIGEKNFVLATDLGAVADRARHYMTQADYLVIEANYDLQMLLHGRYPEYLKARIQTENGHMDNVATAAFLAEIITPRLQHIFLCHLSKDNNTPEKALTAVKNAIIAAGKTVGNGNNTIEDRQADVQLTALPRFEATRLYIFR